MVSGYKFSEIEKQKIVMCLDMDGWEQQGDELTFYNPSKNEVKKFAMWMDAYDFALKLYGKGGK